MKSNNSMYHLRVSFLPSCNTKFTSKYVSTPASKSIQYLYTDYDIFTSLTDIVKFNADAANKYAIVTALDMRVSGILQLECEHVFDSKRSLSVFVPTKRCGSVSIKALKIDYYVAGGFIVETLKVFNVHI